MNKCNNKKCINYDDERLSVCQLKGKCPFNPFETQRILREECYNQTRYLLDLYYDYIDDLKRCGFHPYVRFEISEDYARAITREFEADALTSLHGCQVRILWGEKRSVKMLISVSPFEIEDYKRGKYERNT